VEAIGCFLPPDTVSALKQELQALIRALDMFRQHDTICVWEAFAQVIKSLLGISSQRASISKLSAGNSDCALTARLAAQATSRRQRNSQLMAKTDPTLSASRSARDFDASLASAVLIALHMVAQDCRLAQSRQGELTRISSLVLDLCAATGTEDWYDYWMRIKPSPAPPQSATPSTCFLACCWTNR